MSQDVRGLAGFYDTPLGRRTRALLLKRLRLLWPDLKGRRVLGYGFAAPYLSAFSEAERAIAACPAPLGVTVWPAAHNAAQLCEEDALPFPDLMFDRILIVHGLEASESLRALLRQLWRVLAPEGRVVIVAANRASLWAQVERSPFGHGRPFSRHELDGLLRGALLEPAHWERALYAPPATTLTGSGNGWERMGARLFPGIGGVHIVEAAKSLYAPATPGLAQAVKKPALKAAQDFNRTANSFSEEK
jgi:SAM-dependent methyltransferase